MSKPSKLFDQPNFRRLFAGVTTSHLGDQFALVAVPWLVLQLTGDPVALGIVLALEGAPRALLMLVGGVVVDRLSPQKTLLICDLLRLALSAVLAFAVLTNRVEIWMVYALGFGLGLVAGFAIPARNSITPMVVKNEQLEPANATIMGGNQILGIIGPVTAGVLIGSFASSNIGIGIAFVFNAATFAFSALMLWSMLEGKKGKPIQRSARLDGLMTSLKEGLSLVWCASNMRTAFLIIAAVNLFFVGPIMVGIPVLADERLAQGASAFGLIMSGFAGGNLIGYLLAGALPKLDGRKFRYILTLTLMGFSLTLLVLGLSRSTWIDFSVLAILGIANGYITITVISALQSNTPKDMMGRIMGLFMFSSMGLVPVSQAVSGIICRVDISLLFWLTGAAMATVAIWSATQSTLATLISEPLK